MLTDIGLSEDDFDEFCKDFDFIESTKNAKEATMRIDIIVLALYYANHNLISYRKSKPITKSFYIEPFIIYELVRIADRESYLFDQKLSRELNEEKEASKTRRISKLRSKKAKLKNERYYKEPKIFIDDLYKSKSWRNKTEAAKFITPKLQDYIREQNLPIECINGIPKQDWFDWVYRNL